MTFLGDIGGLYDFIVIFVTPLVGLIVGDRLMYHLLGKLFFVAQKPPRSDDEDDQSPGGK